MLGHKSINSFEMVEKTPVGFFEYDSVAEEVAVLLAEKGHELSFFRTLEDYEMSPDSKVITIVTSSQEMCRRLSTSETDHKAVYIEQKCCKETTATLISEECLNGTSKATPFYLDL